MLLSARLAAKMKHLRIKLVGELDDLLFRHAQRLRFEPIAYFQIIEVALLHYDENDNTLMRHRVRLSNN